MFTLTRDSLETSLLAARCRTNASGALVTFEGTVRNHNAGQPVEELEYDCYEPLALAEGNRILDEARERFDIHEAVCVHRTGALEIGDAAVFIAVSAAHRGDAFAACQYIIDAVKERVPIWKKEHYATGEAQWIDPVAIKGGAA